MTMPTRPPSERVKCRFECMVCGAAGAWTRPDLAAYQARIHRGVHHHTAVRVTPRPDTLGETK